MVYDEADAHDLHLEDPPADRGAAPRAGLDSRADAPVREREERPRQDPRPNERDRRPERDHGESADDGRHDDQASSGSKDPRAKDGVKQQRRSPWLWIILGAVALLAIIGGLYYWYTNKDLESTDDAFIDGRAITIAPKISGYVVELNVDDNQYIHAGDVIAKIDQRDYIVARDQARAQLMTARAQLSNSQAGVSVARKNYPARLASARAQLQSARAALVKAQQDARRQHGVSRAATTQSAVDEADAAVLQAKANVAQADAGVQQAEPVQENIDQASAQGNQNEGQVALAKAQLDQADLNLTYTIITAPQDGWVTKRNVERGNYLTGGSSIMSLVSPQVWVTANFKENQLNRMRPGEHVEVEVDAYPGLKLQGHVDSVQLGSGSRFSAFPAENATGNYVKIVQRIPVKIDIDRGLDVNIPLSLGLSVSPVVSLK